MIALISCTLPVISSNKRPIRSRSCPFRGESGSRFFCLGWVFLGMVRFSGKKEVRIPATDSSREMKGYDFLLFLDHAGRNSKIAALNQYSAGTQPAQESG